MPAFQVIGGGVPTAEEVAAIAVALDVVLGQAQPDAPPPVGPWRWSGRPWATPNWRRSRATNNPERR